MAVTHCLCEKKCIASVIAWARANRVTTVGEIAAATGCSTHCGMCAPFLEYALATGVTTVPYPCPPLPAPSAAR